MKKNYLYVLTVIVTSLLLITGCGQNGTNNPAGITGGIGEIADNAGGGNGGGDDLIGTWMYEEIFTRDYMRLYYTFSSNGEFMFEYEEYYDGEYDYDTFYGTYTVSGNQLSITIEGDIDYFTFSISGNQLALTYDGETLIFTRVSSKSYIQNENVEHSSNSNFKEIFKN